MQPEAMLLDELTNNLDPATKSGLIDILNSLNIPRSMIMFTDKMEKMT